MSQPLLEIRASQFVQVLHESIYTKYVVTKVLGAARHGSVLLAVHRATRQKRAIKEIEKARLDSHEAVHSKFINEVEVLSQLDHPNILKVYEMYEDPLRYYVVTEVCEGGGLFDYLVSAKHMTEQTAAQIMSQVFSALCFCHEKGIVHRNLAPENLLIERPPQAGNIFIKVGDFAMAEIIGQRQNSNILSEKPHHTAPEAFSQSYTEKCDMWSCGVLLYILLSGMPPFDGQDNESIIQAICRGEFDFPDAQWQGISAEAKSLIRRMLSLDPSQRPSARDCLTDPWMAMYQENTLSNKALDSATWDTLKRFSSDSYLRKAFMSFIAAQLLSKDQIAQLKVEFQGLDTDGDGRLSRDELLHGYCRHLPECEAASLVDEVLATIDTDASGFVEYSEFITAASSREVMLSRKNLELAFEACDKDNSGTLSVQELKAMLGEENAAGQEVWDRLIREADKNGDGEIDMKEFLSLMLQASEPA